MRAAVFALGILALGTRSPAAAQSAQPTLPQATPSARDMYVSCFLLVRRQPVAHRQDGTREVFEPEWCSAMSLGSIVNREGQAARKPHFCLPHSAEVDANIPDAMAYAYLDFFERRAGALAGQDARTAYIAAMVVKWPCPNG